VSKASAAATPGSTPAKPTEDFAKGALAKLSSVPVGGSLKVGNVVIGLPSSARVVGHSAICTHQGYPVGAGGRTLDCPCHGSAFDAFTGAVKQGPATAPLPGISLVIKGSYVHHA
jgi:Rieske Fe-S protein